MIDPLTNFIIQALGQICTPQQRLFIFQNLGTQISDLACDKKGTHPLQCLLALITCDEEEDQIVEGIKNDALKLILHINGSHFIQKVCQKFAKKRLEFVFYEITNHFIEIINHTTGVCIAKVIITRFNDEPEKVKKICSLTATNLELLIQNPYGNYAIQHIASNFDPQFYEGIIKKIIEKIVPFSNHKFSSNVVEKFLSETSELNKNQLIQAICEDETMTELLKNKFGNFVIKKALNMANEIEYEELIESLSSNINYLNDSKFKMMWIQYIDDAQQQIYLKQCQNQYSQF